ncbi:MAG TPA: helix-turn-helix domain-containing protein, partial [Nitrospirae bacterium]|nr:helix-turn-helix domain-containing protein [Nitrospirota bacterium]
AEEDPRVFLIALRRVMEAQGVNMTDMAKKSGLNREHLYRILSKRGNPAIFNVNKILPVLGYHLSIESTDAGKGTKSRKGGKTSAIH